MKFIRIEKIIIIVRLGWSVCFYPVNGSKVSKNDGWMGERKGRGPCGRAFNNKSV